jgi:hypothetical protein
MHEEVNESGNSGRMVSGKILIGRASQPTAATVVSTSRIFSYNTEEWFAGSPVRQSKLQPQKLSQHLVCPLTTLGCVTGSSVGQSKPQLQQLSQQQQPQSANSYIQLLQQREEENRVEVERLTAEIRSLKLQLLQVAGKEILSTFIVY